MPKYTLIATDLDGTLFNSAVQISPENAQAIQTLQKKGVLVVPSSGRTLYEMPASVRDNPLFRYIIHSDGASIYDRVTNTFHTVGLSRPLMAQLMDLLAQYETHSSIRIAGHSYCDSTTSLSRLDHYRYSKAYQRFLETFIKPVPDFDTFCRTQDEVEMVCTYFHSAEEQKDCARRLAEIPDLQFTSSEEGNLEFHHKKAGKGNGLWRLADMLGIDRAATIAVGDSLNDISHVQAAGLGLAMGNALDELKAAADDVICSNDEHAMKYILEHYI